VPARISKQTESSAQRSSALSSLVEQVREQADSLLQCSDGELLATCHQLQDAQQGRARFNDITSRVEGFALATEAIRRAHGVTLYDVQLEAALSLADGKIVQMQTGEGKTFVAITAACYLAFEGQGVHVITPNSYLAERDCETAAPALSHLGLTAGLLQEGADAGIKRSAYDCSVTYGTGHEFGFDYLRDQISLRNEANVPLGTRLFDDLCRNQPAVRSTMQRGLAFAIVDEADSVLIDDAGSPLVLSSAGPGEAPDAGAHRTALQLADLMVEEEHYDFDRTTQRIRLTSDGMNRCYADDVAIPSAWLIRPWTEYVAQALRARCIFRRNIHYVVVDDEVRIVDATTGRIFEDRSWQQGLHQAVEAREMLSITPEKQALARMTRQRFFRLYGSLSGLTGTAVGCERELSTVYQRQVVEVPLHLPSARTMMPHRWFHSKTSCHSAIVESVRAIHSTGRPVLVGTRSIEDSEQLAAAMAGTGLNVQVLNGLQTAEEAEIVGEAARSGTITIATNLAGRGTDIKLSPEVVQKGGLHVVVAECQLSGRMDRQLIGRCARQGDPGSAQAFVSADDLLLTQYGGWLADAIRREADEEGEAHPDFLPQLERIQAAAERHDFRARCELLRQDESRDMLFGQSGRHSA